MKKRSRSLMCEKLEAKLPLAGNVMVNVTDGRLTVEGDEAGNSVEIRQIVTPSWTGQWPGYSYTITGKPKSGTTTINDSPPDANTGWSSVTVHGVSSGVNIYLRQGADRLRVNRPPNAHHAKLPGIVNIGLGEGSDNILLNAENYQQVRIFDDGGFDFIGWGGGAVNNLEVLSDPDDFESSAQDDVRLGPLDVFGTLHVKTGAFADRISLRVNLESSRSLVIADGGSGDDHMTGYGAATSGGTVRMISGRGDDYAGFGADGPVSLRVFAQDGNDLVEIPVGIETPIESVVVHLGKGNDVLDLWSARADSALLDGGDGSDSLTNEGTSDFEESVILNFED